MKGSVHATKFWLRITVLLLISHRVRLRTFASSFPEEVLKQIAEETSGEAAKRNLDTITLQHRMRSGTQFETATRHIYDTLRDYGLDEVDFLTYTADGKTMFGTQKSRPVWEVKFAQLWEVREVSGIDAACAQAGRLGLCTTVAGTGQLIGQCNSNACRYWRRDLGCRLQG